MLYVALKMLIGDRGKYIGIILGVAFAALIMTQQPAIYYGLLQRTHSFVSDLALPDIWVTDPKVQSIDDYRPMTSTKLYQVASVEGVAWAKPLFRGTIQTRLRNGNFQLCLLVGVDDATLIGAPAHIMGGRLADLRQADSVIVDHEGATLKLATPVGDDSGPRIPLKAGDTLELNDHQVRVAGIAKTRRSFMPYPAIYTTYSRAIRYIPPQRNVLTYVLVKVKPGEDPQQVAARIKAKTGLGAFTPRQFEELTIDYYMKFTGIPINFGTSVLLGFLVGAAIAGQTFYNFTLENLRYFGMLKAMGATQGILLRMILLQALIVGSIGYGLGAAGTTLFAWLTRGSILAFRFPWHLSLASMAGVAVICLLAAALSIRRVFKLETAIVFRS